MATNPRIGQVDHLLDNAQLARLELHGRVQKLRSDVLRIRHMARAMYDEAMDIERELAGPGEQGGGGELSQTLVDLRSHRAVRKAKPWDGRERRRAKVWAGEERQARHLEVAA